MSCNSVIIYLVFKKASKHLDSRKQQLFWLKVMVVFCVIMDISVDGFIEYQIFDFQYHKSHDSELTKCDHQCKMMVYMLLLCDSPIFLIRSCLYVFQMLVFCCLGYYIKQKTNLKIAKEKQEFGYTDSHYLSTKNNLANVKLIIISLTVCNTIGLVNKAVNYAWAHSFTDIDLTHTNFYFVCDVFTGQK